MRYDGSFLMGLLAVKAPDHTRCVFESYTRDFIFAIDALTIQTSECTGERDIECR
jgi:hypothetical protein